MDIISVPVEVGDAAIVLASVEHNEIHKISNLEISPDSKIVIHLNLSNGHPLKIRSDGVHFVLINRNSVVNNESSVLLSSDEPALQVLSATSEMVLVKCSQIKLFHPHHDHPRQESTEIVDD